MRGVGERVSGGLGWVVLAGMLANAAAQAQTVASSSEAADQQPRAGRLAELAMRRGDRLTGEVVRVDCRGIKFRYLGNLLTVPLDAVATLSTPGDVPVLPGSGNDQIIGRLAIKASTVYVKTRDLGEITVPASAMRCQNGPEGDVALSSNRRGQARVQEQTEKQAAKMAALPDPTSGQRLPAERMALISGTGPDPAGQAQSDQGTQTNPTSSSGQTAKPAPGEPPSGGNKDSTSADAPKTPKEQTEQTERNTLEFLRNEAVLVQPRKIETDFAIGYLHTNQQLGNLRLLTGTAQGRFGIIQGLEAFLSVPFLWGQRQNNLQNQVVSNEVSGFGDIRLGLKYNLIREDVGVPAVVIGTTVSTPTGHHPYLPPTTGAITLGNGQTISLATAQGSDVRDPLNIHLGTWHWALTESVTAFKSFDPIVLFATINYTHTLPATYYNTNISPGDVWELTPGFGFAISDTDTVSSQLFIDYAQPWKFGGTKVWQTGITPISLRLAYTHILSPFDIIEPSLIFGLTRDATDAVVALDYIHRF